MATTRDGIWTPEIADIYALVSDLNTMAATVQSALEVRANTWVGTTAQRTTFTSEAPEGAIWVDSNGEKKIWVKRGNDWITVWDAIKPSEAWTTPTLASNTTSPGHGYPPQVRRIGDRVEVRGRVSRVNGADYPVGGVEGVFTVQSQFRPVEAVGHIGEVSSFATPGFARCEITPDGRLRVAPNKATPWVGLDGFIYYV